MPKFLRLLAVLLFAGTALHAVPFPLPVNLPTCYDLPMCTFYPGTWHYSHQCMKDGFVMYVYEENQSGAWCLGGAEMP
jgi:hypothetical protein